MINLNLHQRKILLEGESKMSSKSKSNVMHVTKSRLRLKIKKLLALKMCQLQAINMNTYLIARLLKKKKPTSDWC